ncbi:nucleoside-diphosphate sugar epimerase/dehydratase [Amylibacter sp. SFDW26]|uniref:polysaccharide biosynthesis protein n=1 Tax=Amylibacter sp. SFDW26 TaxID=2652722 RepID=UPI001D004D8B|nr:nucleoside-diphosphate sugar epimerase/dehydratase [Amylibacter sp. SFDW26]
MLFPTVTVLGALLAVGLGLPRVKLKAFENRSISKIGICSIGLISIAIISSYVFKLEAPRTIPIIFGLTFLILSSGIRLLGQLVLTKAYGKNTPHKRVLVYGAGSAGSQLAAALSQTPELKPVCFVDDNPSLAGLIVSGLPVYSAKCIEKTIKERRIDRIVLAVPSASKARRKALIRELSQYKCEVLILPSFLDMIDGKGLVESLEPVSLEDLLGRSKVELNLPEVAQSYKDKTVMITGAGGSIGSELCRQLMSCEIDKLILFEHSEFALYAIERELNDIAENLDITLISILGSVTDAVVVASTIAEHNVQAVLHAAAYKHVPLVEMNELAGLRNNVIGTRVVAEAAFKANVERFILVSTDKAVRPTNVMGASKRLAELVIQDLASRSKDTLFSMVRFGNVLGSSGSVIPLFRDQIARGGPLTVTHADVTRYFMTIPEAARLVLLAGSFARGGDVFVLDMGKPVRIADLARSMIQLSGLSVKDEDNPEGDIAIDVTGLRPGEKLYEELLIGGDMLTTPHSKILRAQEGKLSEIEVATILRELVTASDTNDAILGRAIVERWVDGYKRANVSGA